MIKIKQKGDFKKLNNFLESSKSALTHTSILDKYGQRGVDALLSNTPVDTGRTALSWSYKIVREKNIFRVEFHNSNIQEGVPIAIILQYGHGTGNGGYVQGIDYINPALKDIFEELADAAWKEVTK